MWKINVLKMSLSLFYPPLVHIGYTFFWSFGGKIIDHKNIFTCDDSKENINFVRPWDVLSGFGNDVCLSVCRYAYGQTSFEQQKFSFEYPVKKIPSSPLNLNFMADSNTGQLWDIKYIAKNLFHTFPKTF